jgi:hypothetical protein
MDLLFSSPSAMVILLALLTIVLIQILGDFNEAKTHAKAKRLLAKTKNPPRNIVSIIVEANNKSVFQTIESLEQSSYTNLEVVFVMNGRSTKLTNQLRAYQRKTKLKRVRVIAKRGGLSHTQLVKKYCTGSVVMFVQAGDLLNAHAINKAVAHFRDTAVNAVFGYNEYPVGNSLSGAISASQRIAKRAIARIITPKIMLQNTLEKGVIYRKSYVLKQSKNIPIESVYTPNLMLTTTPPRQRRAEPAGKAMLRKTLSITSFLLLAAIVVLIYVGEGYNQAVLTIRALSVLGVVFGVLAWQQAGHLNFANKVSLALITPFAILLPSKK